MTIPIRIDLISDTSTRPTPEMRRVMAEAPVGDEQRGEDPSVNLLCERVAELLGKEDALLLPSGTMCNAIAILVHCRAGDEIIASDSCHIVGSEGAGAAALAGAFVRTIATPDGVFGGDDVRACVRARKPKAPRSRLVEVEQTTNRGGGGIWPLTALESVAEAAAEHELSLHMDGARLLNAVVESGVSARDYAAPVDSAWIDLSKGLGCPIGGVLAGSRRFIEDAWTWKHRLGGAMRQAGVIAAAGLYALDHHVERLAEDHDNARVLAALAAAIPGVALVNTEVETNLVFLDVSGTGMKAPDVAAGLLARGIRIGAEDDRRMRAVTHLDVDRAGVEEAAAALAEVVGASRPATAVS